MHPTLKKIIHALVIGLMVGICFKFLLVAVIVLTK